MKIYAEKAGSLIFEILGVDVTPLTQFYYSILLFGFFFFFGKKDWPWAKICCQPSSFQYFSYILKVSFSILKNVVIKIK